MKQKTSDFLKRYYLPILMVAFLPFLQQRSLKNPRGVIWSDGEGYFVYLPGVLTLGNVHAIPPGSMWPILNEKGEMVVKYTCGVAFFNLPLFLVARAQNDLRGIDRNDLYHNSYGRAVAWTGYLITFLGLFFLQKILLPHFSRRVTAYTVLTVFLGTNLFHYATKEPGMSHVYSFFLFAFLLWHTPRFWENLSWKNALLLASAIGWIVLIRPTNILAVLFVAFYGIYSWADLRSRVVLLWQNIPKLVVAAVVAMLFFIPQMWYWYEMTGHWMRYSYTDEGFIFWKAPKIAEVLFDSQNGLFVYSPLALLIPVGLVWGWRDHRVQAPVLAAVFLLATYIFASWWAWWFGGAFGHRSYVELFALGALPMAFVLEKLVNTPLVLLRGVLTALWVFFLYYSVQTSMLYTYLPGPWDGPEWRWNFEKVVWIWGHLLDWGWMK